METHHWFILGLLLGTVGNYLFNTYLILTNKDGNGFNQD